MVIVSSISYSYVSSNKNSNKGCISKSILPFIKIFKCSVTNICKMDENNISTKRAQMYSDFTLENITLTKKHINKLSIVNIKGVDKKWLLSQIKNITLFLEQSELLNRHIMSSKSKGTLIKSFRTNKPKECYSMKLPTNNSEKNIQRNYRFPRFSDTGDLINIYQKKIARGQIIRSKTLPHQEQSVSMERSGSYSRAINYFFNKIEVSGPNLGENKSRKAPIPSHNRKAFHKEISTGEMESNVLRRHTLRSRSTILLWNRNNRDQLSIDELYNLRHRGNAMRSLSAFTHLNKASTHQSREPYIELGSDNTGKSARYRNLYNNKDTSESSEEKNIFKEHMSLASLRKVTLEGPYEYN